ncbi:hypothetical protein BSM4216_0513 [Bacillus smithii]|nr:hypothetical protein BSM4216_0513 [Bacillus smithii]
MIAKFTRFPRALRSFTISNNSYLRKNIKKAPENYVIGSLDFLQ